MAEQVEIILRARNEANAALNQAIRQLGQLNGAAAQVGRQRITMQAFSKGIGAISPAAAGAVYQVQALTAATAGLSAAAVGVLALAGALVALGAGGVAAGRGLVAAAASAEQLSNLAQKTGVAASAIQALQRQFIEAGVPVESLNTGLRFLNRSISSNDGALRTLGVTNRDTLGALTQLADAFAAAPDGADKTAVAVRVLGRAGSELIPILNQGGAALAAYIAQARATGLVLSDVTVASLQELDDQIDKVKNNVERLKNAFLTLAAPGATSATAALADLGERLARLPKVLGTVAENVGALQAAFLMWVAAAARTGSAVAGINEIVALAAKKAADLAKAAGPLVPAWSAASKGMGDAAAQMHAAASAADKAKDSTKKLNEELDRLRTFTRLLPEERRGPLRPGAERLPVGQAVPATVPQVDPITAALSKAEEAMRLVLEVGQVIGATLGDLFQNLSQGVGEIIRGLITGAGTIRGAFTALAKAVGDTIITMIGRIVAAMVAIGFIKLLATAFGVPPGVIDAAVGAAGVGSSGRRAIETQPMQPSQAREAQPVAGATKQEVNIEVNSVDARSFLEFSTSPFGAARLAAARMAMAQPI
jgi:uncharacterized phage infection (PIP) family protein YhgE